jgi:hypothetical protein
MRAYLEGNKRHRMGSGAWDKWKRQWFRRQRGIIAAGPAFAFGDRRRQLLHKGGKP